jgi:excinuclease ABC subunit A
MIDDEIIRVTGAKEHNLKNISLDIPKKKLVVITGPSGSGKSSLAFDTVYAEGQRRYVESLSAYARQFLDIQNKPDVDAIQGLAPAIAIDQKTTSRNPRSTVGTMTEIYDYLRLLYARIGVPYSPATGLPIQKQSISDMVDRLMRLPLGTRCLLMAPTVRNQKGEFRKEFLQWKKQGFQRVRVNGEMVDLDDEIPALDKQKKHEIMVVVDRIVVAEDIGNRLADSIELCVHLADGLMAFEVVDYPGEIPDGEPVPGEVQRLSQHFACPVSGFQLGDIEPRMFSFNSPVGACSACEGMGWKTGFDPERLILDPHKTINDGALSSVPVIPSRLIKDWMSSLAHYYQFSLAVPYLDLPENIQKLIMEGSGAVSLPHPVSHHLQGIATNKERYPGLIRWLDKMWDQLQNQATAREKMEAFRSQLPCSSCHGYRLSTESLTVKVAGKHIGEVSRLTIQEALEWFGELPRQLSPMHQSIAERILKEIQERLRFLLNVGLDYLTLARESATLSGGETQRIRLASQIGSGLTGVIYVLDEPSIGLHQSDNARLIRTLHHLRDLGNSVLVVEHDEETMRASDYLIDMGPAAGVHGGQVVAAGRPEEVAAHPTSLTGRFLSGRESIPVPTNRRQGHPGKSLNLYGARANNLQSVDVRIPLGTFTCVTGVSGGGKSSLILKTLHPAVRRQLEGATDETGPFDRLEGAGWVDRIIQIDQSPIGRTPRSNAVTYTGAFTPMRDWFAGLPESKLRGYKAGRFSFNVKGGRCDHCEGDGVLKIEMHFLPDVYVPCDHCKGLRYNRETLEIKVKDRTIADVLRMTVEEAVEFFHPIPSIREKLDALMDVGLGYIQLGQSATTLSGGEAQRVKLAKELAKRATGRTLYILDEPTTGLHADDIRQLLGVLHRLVDLGNSVLVIEHNMDVIKTADYVIDVGPGGGRRGGRIVASGTPEEVAACEESLTGQFLRPYLTQNPSHA